ncbi:MAG: sulfotransferase domain-containing protein [Wenzhouxiangella sp.]
MHAIAPDFIIAGAPKCGTTSLHHWLNQHPSIHMLPGEPHFFSTDLAYNDPPMPAGRYARLFDGARPGQLRGDRSTWYLYSSAAAAAIHAANPQARILILVRQPADMLHSLHTHFCQRGRRETVTDLGQAMALESERRQGRKLPPRSGFPEKFYYSMLPDYAAGIRRFQAVFGPEQVRVVLFDDLRERPQQTYAGIISFLGLPAGFQPDFSVYNQASPLPDSLFRRLWRQGTWRYTGRRFRPRWWQRFHLRYKQHSRARAAARQPRRRLDPALHQSLTERFENQIRELEALIERDLSAWRDQRQESSSS